MKQPTMMASSGKKEVNFPMAPFRTKSQHFEVENETTQGIPGTPQAIETGTTVEAPTGFS